MTDSSTVILRGRRALLRVGRFSSMWIVAGSGGGAIGIGNLAEYFVSSFVVI